MLYLRPYPNHFYKDGQLHEQYSLRLLKAEPLDFKQVCDLLAHRTTFEPGEILGMLTDLRTIVIENIEDGRGTDLGPLGMIDVTVEATSKPTERELDLKTFKRMKLIFKPAIEIKKALKSVRFHIKRTYVYPKKDAETPEQE